MTLETPSADAARTRRAIRQTSAPLAPEAPGVLTRAELRRRAAAARPEHESHEPDQTSADAVEASPAAPFPSAPSESLAETVVADVAAAIAAEALGAQPDPTSRRRLRRAAQAVFAEIAEIPAETPVDVVAAEAGSAFVAPEPCDVDEFEFAARLFSFTGETPVQRIEPEADDAASTAAGAPVQAAASVAHVAERRPRRVRVAFQRVAATSFSIGVMTIVGLLAVGTTTPAEALASASGATQSIEAVSAAPAKKTADIQAFVSGSGDAASALDRPDGYGVESMADIAAASGVTEFAGTWVTDPSAAIQWPFPVGVPVSATFGSMSYLGEFGQPHHGVDLTPGIGAEIHVIAGGTVRIATEAGGDYGVTVVVDHIVDGQLVSTRYGHMLRGSLQVSQGETVTAGQVIGRVGQTGKATGPHLHFEVLLGGTTPTDPLAWMYEHTTGTHTVG